MNHRHVPMPPRVAALATDQRGYPIFYTIQPPDGRALDFRVVNNDYKERCATRKLCGVCGQVLGYRFWFLGSRDDWRDRIFGEPPMHRECVDYSRLVCPFLRNTYEPLHKPIENPLVVAEGGLQAHRSDDYGLFETRGMRLLMDRGSVLYKADAFTAVEWYGWDGERKDVKA
jgi:hypothetical protein